MIPLSTMVNVQETGLAGHQPRRPERSIFRSLATWPRSPQSEALALVANLSRSLFVGYHAVLGGQAASSIIVQSLLFALVFDRRRLHGPGGAIRFLPSGDGLTILPLSVAGAMVGLFVGKSLSIYSMIGVPLLMGITKKIRSSWSITPTLPGEKALGAREAMLEAGR
jgi:hypothetical protein